MIHILTKVLRRKKKHAKWIPHQITDEQIQQRIKDSRSLFHKLVVSPKVHSHLIVTCDESWFYLNYFHDEAYLQGDQ